MKAALEYFDKTIELLRRIREKEVNNVDKTVEICVNSIANDGLVFLFGAGHSRMMAEEMTPRQGCFVGFFAMVEQALSNHANIIGTNGLRAPLHLEKYEGYAEQVLKGFHFGSHDAFIVISTSGIRPVIVEMALGAKKRGLPVISILSAEHSHSSPPAHSSGKKLIDVADVVIDNQCPRGDCVMDIEGLEWRTGPVSTVMGAMIINMIRCETAARLIERGHKPVLLPSHQLVGNTSAEEQLERFYEAYRKSLAHLYA
jgi:uncharacterized phosphosugar-binding protein